MSDPESVFLVDSLFYHSEADGGCLTLRVCVCGSPLCVAITGFSTLILRTNKVMDNS